MWILKGCVGRLFIFLGIQIWVIDLLTALWEAILISVFKLSPKVNIEIINDYN